MDNKTVYVIGGPTSTGKSTVAYFLAKRIGGEIVNCDSVQLYRYMNIGSAKPSEEMMKLVPHHLFSIVDPDYNMTVATYRKLAMACINDILERGKTPIVVGGTGLYINSVLYDMDFAGSKDNGQRRRELEAMAEQNGSEYMYQYLTAIDPESAERIHPNNLRKVIRAIEAFELGDGIKPLNKCSLNQNYDFKFYAMNMDRDWLYDRINLRVNKLIEAGLVDEVRGLLKMGYTEELPSMKAIGYKEIIEHLRGNCTLDEAIENIQKNTRHYAKRQLTWLKRYDELKWVDISKNVSVGEIVDRILFEV